MLEEKTIYVIDNDKENVVMFRGICEGRRLAGNYSKELDNKMDGIKMMNNAFNLIEEKGVDFWDKWNILDRSESKDLPDILKETTYPIINLTLKEYELLHR